MQIMAEKVIKTENFFNIRMIIDKVKAEAPTANVNEKVRDIFRGRAVGSPELYDNIISNIQKETEATITKLTEMRQLVKPAEAPAAQPE